LYLKARLKCLTHLNESGMSINLKDKNIYKTKMDIIFEILIRAGVILAIILLTSVF